MKNIFRELLDLVFPDKCNFCNSLKGVNRESLCCSSCYTKLSFYKQSNIYDPRLICLFHYKGILKEALLSYKFRGETAIYKSFLYFLDERLRAEDIYKEIDIISSVPISPERFKERGFNQSKLIAKALSKKSKIPYKELLYRPKQEMTQSKLASSERVGNKGRFFIYDGFNIVGKRILLVDDLLTSGATLNEIKEILEGEGLASLYTGVIASSRVDL